jgi:putative ABC transport system permease protein
MLSFILIIAAVLGVAVVALGLFFGLLLGAEFGLSCLPLGRAARLGLLVVKSLRRNLQRTSLTYLAGFVLVLVVILIWSLLYYLDEVMGQKTRDLKLIVSEKWQINSELPFSYAADLCEAAARPGTGDLRPQNAMTWQFYVGSIDPTKHGRDNLLFFIALDPNKIDMLDDVFREFNPQAAGHDPNLTAAVRADFEAAVRKMRENKRAAILGRSRLAALNKRVGERFIVTSQNYPGINLEFDIVGVFPLGRYNMAAIMNRDYLNDALEYYRTREGTPHPMANRSLNWVWLQVGTPQDVTRVGEQIDRWSGTHSPAIKSETLASGVAGWLSGYTDLIKGMRWLLAPAILVTLTLVIANSISISVRERRLEMAVLKVLGYRPRQILLLVLGEAVLIGTLSGLISGTATYLAVNQLLSHTSAELPLYVPAAAFWWGPAAGALTGFLGSFVPAVTACRVRVAEVFARVT